jgi:hypothetical protein
LFSTAFGVFGWVVLAALTQVHTGFLPDVSQLVLSIPPVQAPLPNILLQLSSPTHVHSFALHV